MKALLLGSVILLSFSLSCGKGGNPVDVTKPHGVWVSSGGDLLGNANNPWWVKNTAEVRYCIVIDAEGFSPSEEFADRAIQKAVKIWKEEFLSTVPGVELEFLVKQYHDLGISTQEFKKIPCDGNEDLRFQFGNGTLTPEQRDFLKGRQVIGTAVRTEYDEANLKGKGLIFIASDKGSESLGKIRGLQEGVWSEEGALYLALTHEIGHTFGVPHSADTFNLMSPLAVEMLVMEKKSKTDSMTYHMLESTVHSYVTPPTTGMHCWVFANDSFQDFFGFKPKEKACIEFGWKEKEWQLFLKDGDPKEKKLLLAIPNLSLTLSAYRIPIMIRFDRKQNIFPVPEREIESVNVGLGALLLHRTGLFALPNGEKKWISLTFGQSSVLAGENKKTGTFDLILSLNLFGMDPPEPATNSAHLHF